MDKTDIPGGKRTTGDSHPANPLKVWDPLVRLFHWSLVACVILNQFFLEPGERAHEFTGYLASALVVVRIIWGFVGTRHARFSDFFPTPARLLAQTRGVLCGRPLHYVGHNPFGALMMLALMAMVLALGLTGWMQGLDAFWGEEWLQDVHEGLAEALLLMAGLHAAAAIVMGRLERVNLVRAMITGFKVQR